MIPDHPSSVVPLLETERLVLRRHTSGDLPDVLATWSDPDVVRFIGGRGSTEEEAWQRLLRYAGSWALLGFGFWRVGEKESGAYLGDVGFFHGRRGLGPDFDEFPECGWTITARAHGRGYASEAVAAIHVWGDVHLPVGRTVCIIDPDNAPSNRLAARVGYREFGRSTYKDAPIVLFERLSASGKRG